MKSEIMIPAAPAPFTRAIIFHVRIAAIFLKIMNPEQQLVRLLLKTGVTLTTLGPNTDSGVHNPVNECNGDISAMNGEGAKKEGRLAEPC
jgi:hypothetical protein